MALLERRRRRDLWEPGCWSAWWLRGITRGVASYERTVGLMFAFSLKRFMGSYLFFSCTSRR